MFEVANQITLAAIELGVASTGSTTITSTNSSLAIDLAPYINAGKRPVHVVCFAQGSTQMTSTSASIVYTLYECTSSAGTFTEVSTASAGATLAVVNTSTSGVWGEFTETPLQRWVTVVATITSTAALSDMALGAAVLATARTG